MNWRTQEIQNAIKECSRFEDIEDKLPIAAKARLWVDREGAFIPMETMTDTRLIRCWRLVLRMYKDSITPNIGSMYAALSFLHGEMAIESVESEIRSYEEYGDEWGQYSEGHELTDHPMATPLEAELNQRGLQDIVFEKYQ